VEPVYSVKDFHDALNVVLTKLDMASLSSDIAHDAFVCVMSLLQEVRLHHNNKEIGHLSLYRFRRELWLCGIVVMPPKQVSVIFPALIVPNRYTSPADALVPFDGLVEAKCKDGRLQVYVGGRKAA
jgi:hypothetical protein